eukprot:Opistho-2@71205
MRAQYHCGEDLARSYGQFEVRNHTTGDFAWVDFKQRGWFGKGAYEIEGYVFDKSGQPRVGIDGKWNEYAASYPLTPEEVTAAQAKMSVRARRNSKAGQPSAPTEPRKPTAEPLSSRAGYKEMWRRHAMPPNAEEMYMMTYFAASLNELKPGDDARLCPTDARLRPDQRALENGNVDLASAEKVRLEEAQRSRRKQKEKAGLDPHDWTPRWFRKDTDHVTGEPMWTFTGDYWKERQAGQFTGVVPIY